jgi:DNA invertase Pin-like site-specific DNA recombinase
MAIYGYIRVSTDKQADHGMSLGAQRAKIEAHCAAQGLGLAEVIVDAGVSASTPIGRRCGGAALLGALKAGDIVVATKLDRMFRRTSDCLQVAEILAQKGVTLHVLDIGGGQALDTASVFGRFFLTIVSATAELERGMACERTREIYAYKKANGMAAANVALGQRKENGKVVADQNELAAMARIRELRDSGLSQRQIAKEMDASEFRPRASRWHVATICKVLGKK